MRMREGYIVLIEERSIRSLFAESCCSIIILCTLYFVTVCCNCCIVLYCNSLLVI